MKKIILFVLITFTFFQNIFSQTDFRKGFIISNKNDTINGFIDYREGARKYKICDFKEFENQSVISYEPNQIKGYRYLNDKNFVSKVFVKNDQSKEKVFFEVLVKGKVTLYKYQVAYYIQKNGEKYHELKNDFVKVEQDGKEYHKYTNRHIAALSYLLADCPSIKEKINTIEIRERELTELIELYNVCIDDTSISFKEKKPWFKAHIGLSLGMNTSKINFSSDQQGVIEYLTSDFDSANSIMPGLYFDFLSPRINERIAFHVGVFFLTTTYKSYSILESNHVTVRNDVLIELKQLKIPLGFRYTFPERNFTPYFNIGVSNTLHLDSSSSWIMERERNNVVETFEGEALDIGKGQIGFWGGIGVKKSVSNKLSGFLELRYEHTTGVSINNIDSIVQDNIINFQFLIGLSY